MQEILAKIETDIEFADKRTRIIGFTEKLKGYSGKNIDKFKVKEINNHSRLIKEFLKMNQNMEKFIQDIQETDGEILAVNFI